MKKTLIVLSSPALLFIVYDIFFYWFWVQTDHFSRDVIYSLSVFSIINLAVFFWVIYSVKKIPSKNFYGSNFEKRGLSILAVLILIAIGLAGLYMQLDGILSFDFNEIYSEQSNKSIFYIVIIQIVTYILLFDLYVSKQKPHVFLLVLIFILLTGLMGGRAGVIWTCYFIFFILALRYDLRWGFLITALIFLIFYFVFASILRGTISFNEGDYAIGFLDFNQIFTFEAALNYSQVHGAQFIGFFHDVLNGFLPRSINPDKSYSTIFTRLVFPEVSELTSYTSGFYGNLVFVFGYYGLFVVPIFFNCYK
jgi:hypothetical protein